MSPSLIARAAVTLFAATPLISWFALDQNVSAADAKRAAGSTLGEIRTSWQRREARVRFGSFKWREQRFMSAGYVRFTEQNIVGAADPDSRSATATIDNVTLLLAEGGKARYDTADASAGTPLGAGLRMQSAFDGKEHRQFVPAGRGSATGYIPAEAIFDERNNLYLRALLLVYRPLHAKFLNLDFATFTLEDAEAEVDGVKCLILRQATGAQHEQIGRTIWIDPARDYLPIRYYETVDEKVVIQVNIKNYHNDPKHGWVPQEWETLRLDGEDQSQAIWESQKAKLVEYDLNTPIPDAKFHIDFPAGTRVSDRKAGQLYLLRENGERDVLSTFDN